MADKNFAKGKTDIAFLHQANDEDIDFSDIPEISEEQMANAIIRIGGKPVPIRNTFAPDHS